MKYINTNLRLFTKVGLHRSTLICLSICFAVFAANILTSCQSIQRRIVGMGDPNKFITRQEAFEFGSTYGFDSSTIVFTQNSDSALVLGMKYFGAPALHIFTKDGRLVKYKEDTQDCRAGADDFLYMLSPANFYETSQNKDQKSIWKYLEDKGPNYIDPNVDFYVYITWSKWLGKGITEANAGSWVNSIKRNDKAKIQVILINLDRIK